MDKLPMEILQYEIGKYLDLSGLISISLTNKKLLDVYQPVVEKIILQIDPYSTKKSIGDLLGMLRVGNLERVSFKIYNFLRQSIINEIHDIYDYKRKNEIQTIFFSVIPAQAIVELKSKIDRFVQESKVFIIHRDTVYRNHIPVSVNCSVFETELADILEVMLHEFSEMEKDDDSVSDSVSDSISISDIIDSMDYHPCENIISSFETWIYTL